MSDLKKALRDARELGEKHRNARLEDPRECSLDQISKELGGKIKGWANELDEAHPDWHRNLSILVFHWDNEAMERIEIEEEEVR